MRVRPALLVALAVVLVAWLALWAVGRSTGNQVADRERAEMEERNSAVVARAYKAARDSIPYLRTEARNARAVAEHAKAEAVGAIRDASAVTDSARAVLADTAATAESLRGALAVQVATTDRLSAEFNAYLAADSVSHLATDRLTLKQAEALAKADAALTAERKVSAAWKSAATCRVLWFECPTRTQVAIGSVITTIIVSKAAK